MSTCKHDFNTILKNEGGGLQLWIQEVHFHHQFFPLKLMYLIQPLYREQDFLPFFLVPQQLLLRSALCKMIQK